MTLHVVVGLKRLDSSKQRLSPALDPAARAALMRLMVRHVLDTAVRSGTGRVWLATSEPSATALAAETGADVVDDGGLPWNDGLTLVRDAVVPAGDAVLYLAGDLPLLTAADVQLRAATTGDVVVARARDGGSNALLVRPATALAPAFGAPRSSEVHARAARRAGLRVVVVDCPGLALDVDTATDLHDAERAGASLSGRGRVPAAG